MRLRQEFNLTIQSLMLLRNTNTRESLFLSNMKIDDDVAEKTKRQMQYVMAHVDSLPPRTITVHLQKFDNFLTSAQREGSDLEWYADEAKERGGSERGPSPLSYFLSSLGFCQFVHYVEHSSLEGIKFDSLEMKVDGKIIMQKPRRFTDVSYEVKITSSETDDNIKKLAREAAEDCYVTNTLKRSCNVSGLVYHNGVKIDEHH
ncbi:MAG: OsmC family protein [archaeon]|nr:OsmC family protein [archaeon]